MNRNRNNLIALALTSLVCLVYSFTNPRKGNYYDYTYRIASAILDGELGLKEPPPAWLNEMIPFQGAYYSAFPLGSVLTMLPAAGLRKFGLIDQFPGVLIAALLAGITSFLIFSISSYSIIAVGDKEGLERRILLTLFPVFGTWMWANLAFGGAWHIALGVATAAQLAALYFIILKPNPFLAGLFFAISFGNRTELILLAPIFLYLLVRNCEGIENRAKAAIGFIIVPLALGLATFAYNFARFSSVLDFGYARIPGVLEEPWYRHGIFSLHAIPGNAKAMLFETWRKFDGFPYFVPTGFGGSIFISSPYLIFLFRRGAKDAPLKWLSWGAIVILTFALWCHGNPGGWQFSYRYAIELLPWIFLILLNTGPAKVSVFERILFIVSIIINAVGAYIFLRTSYISI